MKQAMELEYISCIRFMSVRRTQCRERNNAKLKITITMETIKTVAAKTTVKIPQATIKQLQEIIDTLKREHGGVDQHELHNIAGVGVIVFFIEGVDLLNFTDELEISNELLADAVMEHEWMHFEIITEITETAKYNFAK
jgi:hypothetical protein